MLSDEIAHRATLKGISCQSIDHRSGETVVSALETSLADKADALIICTQEAIRRVKPHLLHDWSLVLDEVPKVVDYPDYSLKPVELNRILEYTKDNSGQLQIIEDRKSTLIEQINTHRGDARGVDCSTLGKSAAHVFRLLISDVQVFIDKPMPDGKRHVRAVEEFTDWWDIFSSASEAHVLAASIKNSEFEIFAQVHGFQFKDSEFTPDWRPDSGNVTIYPVVPKGQKFSWRMMTEVHEDSRLIDILLANVLKCVGSTPLLFANKWARFQNVPGTLYVPKDCRGLNRYIHATEAVTLFGGNPSPSDGKGLEYLEEKYGVSFEESFVTSRLLEPTLQAVARTAIRCRHNTERLRFYVQDYRVVEYLQSTYFQDATIDWSLANNAPFRRDGRKLDVTTEAEVQRLISMNISTLQIHKETGVSRQKIAQMKDALQAA
ncbi:hypothetical protein ACIPO9_12790 [Pseudomonas sp. NPDC090203]|uniref:hypothetical protein n=1 Tax=Pseudomonas sp. NPDC090203 TaxID=3364477 RepID=UPI0037FC8D62